MTRGQLAFLLFCLLASITCVIIATVLKATGVSESPGYTHPLLTMICFFGIGGVAGVIVGGGDK